MSVRAVFVLPLLASVVALTGCAAPTFEERLSYLDRLRSGGTITDEEYAIMRRRLVESVDPATFQVRADALAAPDATPAWPADPRSLVPAPAPFVPTPMPVDAPDPRSLVTPPAPEPEQPLEPLSAEWVVGVWRGTDGDRGGGVSYDPYVEIVVEFSLASEGLEWRMTRRLLRYFGCGPSVAEASGTAIVQDGELERAGAYSSGRCMVSEGTPVEFRLGRAGKILKAFSVGTDPHLTRSLILHRVGR